MAFHSEGGGVGFSVVGVHVFFGGSSLSLNLNH